MAWRRFDRDIHHTRDTMAKMVEDPMKWMAGLSESCSAAGTKLMNLYLEKMARPIDEL